MLRRIAILFAALILACTSFAQTWPSKPIKLIVNFPSGSGADTIGRAFAKVLADRVGQPIVIDNRVGAGGNIGADVVARSPADGYTLLWTPGSTLVTNMFLYNTDAPQLQPIAYPYFQALSLVVRAESPYTTASDLQRGAKSDSKKLRYGSSGVGSPMHLAALMWMAGSGFSAEHIPYKSTGEALIGLMNGDIDFYFDAGPSIPFVKQGKIRDLAITSSRPSPLHPGVPTMQQAVGVLVDPSLPGGLYAPLNTPADIVAKLNAASKEAWQDPQYRQALAVIYAEPSVTFLSPRQIEAQLRSDRTRIGQLIRDSGETAEK